MSSSNAAERQLVARLAAHESWANTQNRTARTAPARDAFLAKFEDEVDPRRELTPGDRAKRAANARKAHFTRLALKSAQSRRGASTRREAFDELTEATRLIAFASDSGVEASGSSDTDEVPEGIVTTLRVESSRGALR
jgi:hypothetical protein